MKPILLMSIAAALAGCAPLVYESRYAYEQGWREAKVTDVGAGDEMLIAATTDCRLGMAAGEVVTRTFARVTYSEARNIHSMIVAVAPGDAARPGMTAYVNPGNCARHMHLATE